MIVETPKRIARKKDADVLLMLYLQKRRQQSIDNLIDYLRKRISLIKNKGKSYELKIKNSILNKISDIKSLFQVSQLACDYPEHIVTDAIFSKIDREDVIRILGSQNISELSILMEI